MTMRGHLINNTNNNLLTTLPNNPLECFILLVGLLELDIRKMLFSINSLKVLQLYVQINYSENGQVKSNVHRLK